MPRFGKEFASEPCPSTTWNDDDESSSSLQQQQQQHPRVVTISYNGQVVQTLQGTPLERVLDQSPYLDAVVNRWSNTTSSSSSQQQHTSDENNNVTHIHHDIPSLENVQAAAVQVVLQVLTGKPLTLQMLEQPQTTHDAASDFLDAQVLQVAFYLACDTFILKPYCATVEPHRRVRVARRYFAGQQTAKLNAVLATINFFDGMDKSTIPLLPEFCAISADICMLLLQAYNRAPAPGLLAGFLGGMKRALFADYSVLPVAEFGLRTIQNFCTAEWSANDLDMLFAVLPQSLCNKNVNLENR